MLTPAPGQDYKSFVDALCLDILANPAHYRDIEQLAAELVPGDPANARIIAALKAVPIPPGQFHAAMRRQEKLLAEQERLALLATLRNDLGGREPENETEYVDTMMHARGYAMSYGGTFAAPDGRKLMAVNVQNDLLLEASRMMLTAPRGKVLSDRNISRAFDEWIAAARTKAERAIIDAVVAPAGLDRDAVLAAFHDICKLYFREPDFACAAIQKLLWSAKRKMRGLTIRQHHAIVLEGPQNMGKTTFLECVAKPLGDLAVTSDLSGFLDDANFALRERYSCIVDELAGASHQIMSKLK